MWNVRKIVKKGDYDYALVPEHPNATKNGYVLEHRIVVENRLGRLLGDDEVVHHKDGDRKNNADENLEVFSNSEHARLHSLRVGRQWVRLCCPGCGCVFERERRQSFLNKGTRYTCCSDICRGKFSRNIQLNGETPEVEEAISGNLLEEFVVFQDNREETC